MTCAKLLDLTFFEDSAGSTVTLTSEGYTQVLNEYFFPIFEEKGMGSYLFHQNGATSHTARVLMPLLREKIPRKLISRFEEIDWPQLSPDLIILDFLSMELLEKQSLGIRPQNGRRPEVEDSSRNHKE